MNGESTVNKGNTPKFMNHFNTTTNQTNGQGTMTTSFFSGTHLKPDTKDKKTEKPSTSGKLCV